ncbi:MAG: AbrB/MazE/SpoVT family DNA-binding domain-containing protein [Candidatus Freyarchaeota archaeon]
MSTKNIGPKRQVVIPKHISDALGLKPGVSVEIYSYGTGQEKLPQKIKDVYIAFAATDVQETLNIMKKYGSSYVLVFAPTNPSETHYWEIRTFFQFAGLNYTKYIEGGISDFTFTDLGKRTMIASFTYNFNTEPFKLVYSDEYVKIYQLM